VKTGRLHFPGTRIDPAALICRRTASQAVKRLKTDEFAENRKQDGEVESSGPRRREFHGMKRNPEIGPFAKPSKRVTATV